MKGITTQEQSRRLSKAGLSRETADISFRALAFEQDDKGKWLPQKGTPIKLINGKPKNELDFPAWSMAALWTTLNESGIFYYEYNTGDTVESVMESLVYAVERGLKCGIIKTKDHDKE